MTPATDKIIATAGTKYITGSFNVEKFQAAIRTLEAGEQAGSIYNVEFQDAKYYIAQGTEHAQHIASERIRIDRLSGLVHPNDPRHDIGYAFGMNQAAPLARRLRKLDKALITNVILDYIHTLDQIDAIFKWLKSFKPIIVKGRRPSAKPKEVDVTNTGMCAICENRQKLERHGVVGNRKMVHHGYQMSEYNHAGHRMGKCFGTNFLPYECSNQANKEYKYFLEQDLRDLNQYLADLQVSLHEAHDVLEYPHGLRNPVRKSYAKGTEKYEQERKSRITQTESQIRWTIDQIAYQQVRIDTWRKQPLADSTKVA